MFCYHSKIKSIAFVLGVHLVIAFVVISTGEAKQLNNTLEGGKAHEECMEFGPPQQLIYSFQTKTPVEFNIHYHLEKDVIYPVKQDHIKSHSGVFKPTSKQGYCLMWTNATKEKISIKYEIRIE